MLQLCICLMRARVAAAQTSLPGVGMGHLGVFPCRALMQAGLVAAEHGSCTIGAATPCPGWGLLAATPCSHPTPRPAALQKDSSQSGRCTAGPVSISPSALPWGRNEWRSFYFQTSILSYCKEATKKKKLLLLPCRAHPVGTVQAVGQRSEGWDALGLCSVLNSRGGNSCRVEAQPDCQAAEGHWVCTGILGE